jgi:hypothetical protein
MAVLSVTYLYASITTATDTAMLRVVMAAVEGMCIYISLFSSSSNPFFVSSE